jgi:AraC family transcriptional regulator
MSRHGGSYALPGIWLNEVFYTPANVYPPHSHGAAHITLILDGGVDEKYDQTTRTAEPGLISFLPSGITHATRFLSDVRALHVTVAEEVVQQGGERLEALTEPADLRDTPLLQLMHRLHREIQVPDDFSAMAIHGLVLELLAGIGRASDAGAQGGPPRWLRQVKQCLNDRYRERLVLEAIAATFGVHPSHLCRAFRQYYHVTMTDYLRGLRIEAAHRALCSSTMSIGEIAADTGFCDQSHFTKAFKRSFGMTPAELRRLSRAA